MKQLVTGDEIRKIEQYVINEIGIPSLVLMERAALSVSEHIKKRFSKKDRICVVCGSGNNGADGVAIARQLLEDDYSVQIVLLGKEEKFSFEMKTQTAILENMKIPYQKAIKQDEKIAWAMEYSSSVNVCSAASAVIPAETRAGVLGIVLRRRQLFGKSLESFS